MKNTIKKSQIGIVFDSEEHGLILFENQNDVSLATFPALNENGMCAIPHNYSVEVFPGGGDEWRAGENYQIFAKLVKK